MIFLLVTLTAVGLLLLPGAAHAVGSRLHPREWAWLSALAVGGGVAVLEIALVLRAAPGVLDALGVDAVASACSRVLGPLLAGGAPVTWAAVAAAAAIATAGAVAVVRDRRLRRRLAADLWLGERQRIAGHAVVVLPADRPIAASFESDAPTIVVSRGLLDRLGDDEVDAVVRHEAAHLAHRHQRLLVVAAAAAPLLGRLPGIRRSLATLHLAVERWADEEATGASAAARDALRRSLLQLAGAADVPSGVAAIAEARTIAARVQALAAAPPPVTTAIHAALYAPGLAAAAAVMPGFYRWSGQLNAVVATAGRCAV